MMVARPHTVRELRVAGPSGVLPVGSATFHPAAPLPRWRQGYLTLA